MSPPSTEWLQLATWDKSFTLPFSPPRSTSHSSASPASSAFKIPPTFMLFMSFHHSCFNPSAKYNGEEGDLGPKYTTCIGPGINRLPLLGLYFLIKLRG